jgi:hypothetical protein
MVKRGSKSTWIYSQSALACFMDGTGHELSANSVASLGGEDYDV